MPRYSSAILALAAGASLVQAHGYVSQWTIGGTQYQGFDEQWQSDLSAQNEFIAWSETASDNGYVSPSAYGSGDIICHRGATNAKLNNATVAAGGTVSATWNTWPSSHHGPVLTYIAAANDPTTVDKTTLKWLKIKESGLISGSNPGTWATDKLISNSLTDDITIPSSLKAGNYVLRHEIIALHSATNTDGAQNYPQCVNLQVTGSGSELPTGTAGTSLYSANDKGVNFNLYTSFNSYPIPGPALAFGGSSSSSSGSSSGSASSPSSASSAAATETTTSAATSTTAVAAETTTPAATSTAAAAAAPSSKCNKKRHHARHLKH